MAAKEVKPKVQITISSVLADLKAGTDREQIRIKYNLTKAELKRMFLHPELKGKKVHTGKVAGGRRAQDSFELVDDVETTPATDVANPKSVASTPVIQAAVAEEETY